MAKGAGDALDVATELLLAAARPVVAVEGGLDQRSHDAAHAGLVGASVALPVVFHTQPAGGQNAVFKLDVYTGVKN